MYFRYQTCQPCCPEEGGGGQVPPVTIPLCACTAMPTSLTMTSADDEANHGMFKSCSLEWRTVPADLAALNIGNGTPGKAYLSTESFPDDLLGGLEFRYLLVCLYTQFSLTRVYAVSPYGSPFRDAGLYGWSTGPPNSCTPLRLVHGVAFPGSDESAHVEIS